MNTKAGKRLYFAIKLMKSKYCMQFTIYIKMKKSWIEGPSGPWLIMTAYIEAEVFNKESEQHFKDYPTGIYH